MSTNCDRESVRCCASWTLDVEMPTTYDVLPFSRPPLSESVNSSLNFTIPILIYYLFFVKFYAYINAK
ncbi:hypothetical protein ACN42_g2922 [Penicillium freii]|uniref:Uncharacterized protein n=1 Tax=Penicillium freii TaxID=48697 RepID=A0A101MP86_PENFR|nr:hypothetical protein ACN42_g2922 [Penicillium freii]